MRLHFFNSAVIANSKMGYSAGLLSRSLEQAKNKVALYINPKENA